MQQRERSRNGGARGDGLGYCRQAMRCSWASLLVGVALAALLALLPVGLRTPFAPSVIEVLLGDTGAAARWGAAWQAAVASAIACALLLRATKLGNAAGSYGACVAAIAAAGLTTIAATLPIVPSSLFACAVGAAIVCACVAPLLRERGIVSLAFGGLVAALPSLMALRMAHALAQGSVPLEIVRQTLAKERAPLSGLLLGNEVDESLAFAIGLRMAPPWEMPGIPILAARADSAAGSALRRLGISLHELAGSACRPVAADAEPWKRMDSIAVSVARDDAVRPVRVFLTREQSERGGVCIVVTPLGSVEGAFDEVGGGTFDDKETARLRRMLLAMPLGSEIRVVAIPPSAADPTGWIPLLL